MTNLVCLYTGPGKPPSRDGSAWEQFTTRATSPRGVRRAVRATRTRLGEGWSVQATDRDQTTWRSDILARHGVARFGG